MSKDNMKRVTGVHLFLGVSILLTSSAIAQDISNVYRFWSNQIGTHFYTISKEERDAIILNMSDIWTYEGSVWSGLKSDTDGALPIYRFWEEGARRHFFTINEAEKDYIIENLPNWRYEMIAWYAYPTEFPNTSPVYRFWNDIKQAHFYTFSEAEKDFVIANMPDWQYETIAWYANSTIPDDTAPPTLADYSKMMMDELENKYLTIYTDDQQTFLAEYWLNGDLREYESGWSLKGENKSPYVGYPMWMQGTGVQFGFYTVEQYYYISDMTAEKGFVWEFQYNKQENEITGCRYRYAFGSKEKGECLPVWGRFF